MTGAGVWEAICRCLGRKINCSGNDPDTPVGSTLTSSFYTPGIIPVANWNTNGALVWPYEGGFSTKVMIAGKVRGGGTTGGEWTEVCGMSASKYGGNLYQFAQQ